jgi:hypothetical protein
MFEILFFRVITKMRRGELRITSTNNHPNRTLVRGCPNFSTISLIKARSSPTAVEGLGETSLHRAGKDLVSGKLVERE